MCYLPYRAANFNEELWSKMSMQKQITLSAKPRGFHLVTDEIERALTEIQDFEIGILHLFILHTSASLTINENADRDVRRDFETFSSRHLVPENFPYVHTAEGPDDMPAHLKASLFGSSVTIPVQHGRLVLGTWQGIYFCEHRDEGGRRRIFATLLGDSV
jgi:secondary thiamine-phosphate synthase enzyme